MASCHDRNDDRIQILARPEPPLAYESPLHKVREAWQTPQLGSGLSGLRMPLRHVVAEQTSTLLLSTLSSSPQVQSPKAKSTCGYSSESSQFLPIDHRFPYRLDSTGDFYGYSGQGDVTTFVHGIESTPILRIPMHDPRNKVYCTSTSLLSSLLSSNPRTRAPFKPQKSNRGTSSWQLKQYAEATLGSGSLRKAVKLPEGEDKDEWLAVNGESKQALCHTCTNNLAVVDFYNQINLLYGSITEFCSPQSCPEMKATDEFEYLWQDNDNFKKPTKMPAPEYIEHLMAWVQSNVDNEQMFPSRIGVPFPKTFPALLRNIFKRLYRVYAHIYCHHYPVIIELGLEPHLNTSFKHYVLFIDEHGLSNGSKDFWGPLGDLVESMLRSD